MKRFYDKDGKLLGTFLEDGDAPSGGVDLYNHHIVIQPDNYEGIVFLYLQTDSDEMMDYMDIYDYIKDHGFSMFGSDTYMLGGCVSGTIITYEGSGEVPEPTYNSVVALSAHEEQPEQHEMEEAEVMEENPSEGNYIISILIPSLLEGITVAEIMDNVTPVSSSDTSEEENNSNDDNGEEEPILGPISEL